MVEQLVQKQFALDNISFDCWMINIIHKFWFKAHGIAVFLDYKNPNQSIRKNIPSEARKQWGELEPALGELVPTPSNWKPHTILTSEGGLYRLICKSTKPVAVKFEKWVFDEVLRTLRQTGTYTMNQQIQFLTEQVQQLEERVAVMTVKDKTKHVFRLYRNVLEPNEYLFIRVQGRYLRKAMEAVDPEIYEMLLNEVNVPNSMNILNRLKEKLVKLHISFRATKNKLSVDADVLEMVENLLQEHLS